MNNGPSLKLTYCRLVGIHQLSSKLT